MVYRINIYLALILLFCSCKGKQKVQNNSIKRPPVLVDVLRVEQTDQQLDLIFNGSIIADETVEIKSELNGRVAYLNMPDGKNVIKGTLLAKLNNDDLVAQKKQITVQLDLASKTEKRLATLLQNKSINEADYDAALSQVNLLKANMEVLDAQIAKTEIRAPFAGKLGLRNVSIGAVINPNQVLTTLQKMDQLKIDIAVPEKFISLFKIGQRVSVDDAQQQSSTKAIITAIDSRININTNHATVRAIIKSSHITPGSFVTIKLSNKQNAISVPTNAIIPDALSNQVIVIKNDKPKFTNVITSNRYADMIQITEGLNNGDSVVISGVLFVRPDSEIKIKQVKSMVDFNPKKS